LVAAILAIAAVVAGAVIVYHWWQTRGPDILDTVRRNTPNRTRWRIADAGAGPGERSGNFAGRKNGGVSAGTATLPALPEIFVTGSSGKALTQLTQHPATVPAWSPDGKMLAFTRIAADDMEFTW